MNFPGRFDPKASDVATVSLDSEHFTFAPNASAASQHDIGSGVVVIPDAHLLFSGDYKRAGNDLVLSSADQKYVVHDYFKTEKRPTLVSQDGATLSGHVVSALTGHAQYAQASAPASGQVIGQVMKLSGSASAIRNGVAVELNIGDSVQKGDVIQTGSDSSIGLTLADGTVFGMTSNARMVLNEMIYDPNGSSNSSLVSLVQGTITFVAGQTAKNGNMRVDTPVATMGIRGTAVLVEISANDGPTKFSVLLEPDGKTGSFNLYDKVTGQLLGTVSQAGQVTFVSPTGLNQPATAIEQQKTLADLQAEKALIQQVFQLYFPNYNPDDSKPNSTKTGPRTDIGVPENVIGKYAINPDTGRATLTYAVPVTNPDTHQTTIINIVYTNTPPSFSVTNAEDVQSAVLGPNSFKLGDHVTITDPDIGVAPFFDVAFHYRTDSGLLALATGPSSTPGPYLVDQSLVSLDRATGVVTYNPIAFRFLGDGETAVYKFTFVAASGVGGSGSDAASLTVYLTVTGQNDAPVFAVSDTAPPSFIEIANVTHPRFETNPEKLESTIILDFTDEDFVDAVFDVAITGVTVSAVGADASKVQDTLAIDFLSLTAAAKDQLSSYVGYTGADGKVTLAFSANDSVFDFLAEDQQIVLTYTVRIEDSHGTFDTQTVTITVTGTNDKPQLVADTGPHTLDELTDATLVGSIPTLLVSGTLDFADVDLTDAHSTTKPTLVGDVEWLKPAGGGGYVSAGTVPPATLLALADAASSLLIADSVNGATGQVSWSFALADSFVDFLAEGETLTLTYNVNVDDGHSDVGTATQPVTIVVTGTNDAPSLTADVVLPSAAEDSGGTAQTLSSLFAGNVQDVDQTSYIKGFAISDSGVSSDGAWWFSDNGGVWSPIGTVSQSAALIVGASVLVKFLPNTDFNGDPPSLTVYAIDDTYIGNFSSGSGGARYSVDLTQAYTHGDTSPISQDGATISTTITPVNDAPLASGTATLAATDEDTLIPAGGMVGNLFSANFSDARDDVVAGSSADNFAGIAITAYTPDSAKGDWEYSIDNGSNWVILGTASFSATVLLGSSDLLRFVPAHDYNGAATALSANLIESGEVFASGDTINLSIVGGTTHFSANAITLNETINAVNDAPVVTAATLTAIAEDTISPAGDTIANLFPAGTKFTDVDDGATLTGIAISAYTPDSAKGAWEYNDNNGGGWHDIGVVTISASLALILSATSSLRFVPAPNFNGPAPALTVYGIDDTFIGPFTAATTFQVQDLSAPTSVGGTTPFSGTATTIGASITAVNDAPEIISNSGGVTATITVDENTTSVTTVQATDIDGPNVIYEIVTGMGSLDAAKFAINATTGELTFVAAPDHEAPSDANNDNSYIVQVRATDGTLTDTQTLTVNVTDVIEGPTYLVNSTADNNGLGTLRAAINFANSNPGTTILFSSAIAGQTITLTSELPLILGNNTIIDGTTQQITVDGASTYRAFFIGDAGQNSNGTTAATISNLTIQNATAKGGKGGDSGGGGGGGGGAGLGGAIFVSSTGALLLSNVTLDDNAAIGGNGGNAFTNFVGGAGGGGMGGDGGGAYGTNRGGGGGGFGNSAAGGQGSFGGAAGSFTDSASGGDGPTGGVGGAYGGGGGSGGVNVGGGGGGVGGSDGFSGPGGGAGGFGGGGGGGYGGGGLHAAYVGGDGGYGGGGGSGGVSGDGGFGGGGGGGQPAAIDGIGGAGGFGGGAGFSGTGGGGGAGMGGAVFVMAGGTLTVSGTLTVNGSSVTGGAGGGAGAVAGGAFGSGIFTAGSGTIAFAPGIGIVQEVTNAIDDQTGSGGSGPDAGSWGLTLDGAGMLKLLAANNYTGATTVVEGTLQVNGSIANSTVTVEDGGALEGSGTTGAVFVESGGTLAAGDSTTNQGPHLGILHTGNLSLAAGAIITAQIEGYQPGQNPYPGGIDGYDQIQVNGTVTLTGAVLNAVRGAGFYGQVGNTYKIIDNDGSADAVVGTFNGLSEGATFTINGAGGNLFYSITYAGGDGNDVVVSRVSQGNAPFAGDDAIVVRSDYGAIKSTLTTNDFDPDDTPPAVSFAISGAEHIVPNVSSTPATAFAGGFKVQGTFGTLFLYSAATFDPIFNDTAHAGDYVFDIGHDINGGAIPGSEMAALHDLAPGQFLNDYFTYTITDTTNIVSAPANITVTFEIGPVKQYVLTSAGYDTTTLWDDIHDGTITDISTTGITIENDGRTIAVDTKYLDWDVELGQTILTSGLIKGFHVTDGFGAPLFDATGYNIDADDFEAAINHVNPDDLNNILKTYAYDIQGSSGADLLLGGDFDPNNAPRDDRIDTGGGADAVLSYGGDDLIIVYDNKPWQIDGGAGIDTIRLDGQFDLINGPPGQAVLNVEILDLNKTYVNTLKVEAEGVAQINGDHTIRILGSAADNVTLVNQFTGHENGHWSLTTQDTFFPNDTVTGGTHYALYEFVDGGNTYATAYVEQGVNVNVDVLNGDQITTYESGGGVTTVFDTYLNDFDQNALYSVSAVADHGSVTTYGGTPLDAPISATVQNINYELQAGLVYTPNNPLDTPDGNGQLNDKVTLTATDSSGISDTLNFVFRQQGNGPATLVGTNQKDVIFSTENNDTLTGLSGKDNFVFANSSGQDTVTDFQVGIDHLVLNDYPAQFEAGNPLAFMSWLNTADVQQSGNDTIIDLDSTHFGQNTITLQNVQKASLSMNDFILHPSGGGGM